MFDWPQIRTPLNDSYFDITMIAAEVIYRNTLSIVFLIPWERTTDTYFRETALEL